MNKIIDIKLETAEDLATAFKMHGSLIYNYFYQRVNYRKQIAEDLAQEVFMKAWQNRQKFNAGMSNLKTWLFVIAHNLLIDFYREKQLETIQIEIESEESMEEDIVQIEMVNFIKRKMLLLNKDEQELITMRFINELTLDEIAYVLHKNTNTVKVALHRALIRLKDLVNEENQ